MFSLQLFLLSLVSLSGDGCKWRQKGPINHFALSFITLSRISAVDRWNITPGFAAGPAGLCSTPCTCAVLQTPQRRGQTGGASQTLHVSAKNFISSTLLHERTQILFPNINGGRGVLSMLVLIFLMQFCFTLVLLLHRIK